MIWAAILVVASHLVPSLAHAHAGHAHHAAATAHVATTPDPATPAAVQANSAQVDGVEATRPAPDVAVVALAQSEQPATSCPTNGCTGGCCGTVGCCGAAILTGPAQALPDGGKGADIGLRRSDTRAGIDPEALAKPPRVVA